MSSLRRSPMTRKAAEGSFTSFKPRTNSVPASRKSTPPLQRGKGIAPRSKRMAKYYRDVRIPAVKAAVGDGGNPCQARTSVCTGYVETLHEPASRGRFGGLIPAVAAGGELPTCHRCNSWISEHPREAKAAGLLRSAR